jgi:hypothetical protein
MALISLPLYIICSIPQALTLAPPLIYSPQDATPSSLPHPPPRRPLRPPSPIHAGDSLPHPLAMPSSAPSPPQRRSYPLLTPAYPTSADRSGLLGSSSSPISVWGGGLFLSLGHPDKGAAEGVPSRGRRLQLRRGSQWRDMPLDRRNKRHGSYGARLLGEPVACLDRVRRGHLPAGQIHAPLLEAPGAGLGGRGGGHSRAGGHQVLHLL